MKVLYLSNFFNYHQKALSDEFYSVLGGDYNFIETTPFPEYRKQVGFKEYSEDYLLKYNEITKAYIDGLIEDADVVICGEAPVSLVSKRYREGKLTFRDDESRYKMLNRYLKWPIYTYQSLSWNKGYLLCASAFGCWDYHVSGMKVSKCFKWGYFPKVKVYDEIDTLLDGKDEGLKHSQDVSILWVGRLIGWKHPELAIEVAKKLKTEGVPFHLNIIGIGYMQGRLEEMIQQYGLSENVTMLGALPPEQVRQCMEKSHIYLFTSDRGEGWGVVLNEAMNSACAVVSSPVSGASPYLIEDGKNGLFFKDKDAQSLYEKVLWLVRHPELRRVIGKSAYETIRDKWSAKNAIENFMKLVDALQRGEETPILSGPCSKAPLLKRNWYK